MKQLKTVPSSQTEQKLPEENLDEAMKNYKKIYSNLSNKDLKDIEIIDLRVPKQAIIKYRNTVND